MPLDCFSKDNGCNATSMILMEELDHKRCAHIFQKRNQSHLQNHHGQNNFTKAHTPYSKNRCMKNLVIVSKYKQMPLYLKQDLFQDENHQQKGGGL
jgi:hypothetical protein